MRAYTHAHKQTNSPTQRVDADARAGTDTDTGHVARLPRGEEGPAPLFVVTDLGAIGTRILRSMKRRSTLLLPPPLLVARDGAPTVGLATS